MRSSVLQVIVILVMISLVACSRKNINTTEEPNAELRINSDLSKAIEPGENISGYCKSSDTEYFCQLLVDVPALQVDQFNNLSTVNLMYGQDLKLSLGISDLWIDMAVTFRGEDRGSLDFFSERSNKPQTSTSLDLIAGRQYISKKLKVYVRESELQPRMMSRGVMLPNLTLKKLLLDIIVSK